MDDLFYFDTRQIKIVTDSVSMAEELVSNFYKMSASQWTQLKYDVVTLADLAENEIVYGPFAQVIRYEARQKNRYLGSSSFHFYKICIQDHAISDALATYKHIDLFPFSLYIMVHELIHVVRFNKFLQHFDASEEERVAEEERVHRKTREILASVRVKGMDKVFLFYRQWKQPLEYLI
ncbi:hypothetical protein QUF76_03455 [Desulfobacterales bacterium HSG16]|nr:hypothetical protein [Desulfobacterales bacterium HSG16]